MAKFNSVTVFLNVNNLEKSAAFYEGLGFKRGAEYPGMSVVGYTLGQSTLMIGWAHDPEAPAEAKAWLAHKPWGTGVMISPQVNDLDDVYARAIKVGAEIEMPPTTMPWGSRSMTIADPDGYSIMFDQPSKAIARKAAKKAAPKKAAKKAPARAAKKVAPKKKGKSARKGR